MPYNKGPKVSRQGGRSMKAGTCTSRAPVKVKVTVNFAPLTAIMYHMTQNIYKYNNV